VPFKSIVDRIKFDPAFDQQTVDSVRSILKSVYADSPTARTMFDKLGGTVVDVYLAPTSGSSGFVKKSPAKHPVVLLNFAELEAVYQINQVGKIVKTGIEDFLVHELAHAINKSSDPTKHGGHAGFDYLGDTVKFTNKVMTELGLDLRLSYSDAFAPYPTLSEDDYTNGTRVDLVAVDWTSVHFRNGRVDTTASSTKDLFVDFFGRANEVRTGAKADFVWSNDGDDTVKGGKGADEIHGGSDKDKLYGDAHEDRLFGDAGNDKLYGGSENDELDGGLDDDTLDGGAGADNLVGGDGADQFQFRNKGRVDTIADFHGSFSTADAAERDLIVIDTKMFGGNKSSFEVLSSAEMPSAVTAGKSTVLFSNDTGMLVYDRDGLGGKAAVVIAQLVGLNGFTIINHDDILLV
jgi:Ca2+-binding RTX toxin-like protein